MCGDSYHRQQCCSTCGAGQTTRASTEETYRTTLPTETSTTENPVVVKTTSDVFTVSSTLRVTENRGEEENEGKTENGAYKVFKSFELISSMSLKGNSEQRQSFLM